MVLKINLKKTKALIFQKQNPKSTRDIKYTFFLNENQIANVTENSYLGIKFNSMEVSQFQNNYLRRKQEDQYFVQNAILIFISFQLLSAITSLMPFFFLSYYTVLRNGVLMIELMLRNGKKTPLKKIHTQFYKHFICLNKRATNIISRNEARRLSLKSHINKNVVKFC